MTNMIKVRLREQFLSAALLLVLGWEWLQGGWGKLTGGKFAAGLPQTLEFFASKNPHDWYAAFLLGPARANAAIFGQLVQWGELAAGLGLLAGAAALIFLKPGKSRGILLVLAAAACGGGMLMNGFYFLAAGWTSPSTSGLNAVMFWTQSALAGSLLSERRKTAPLPPAA